MPGRVAEAKYFTNHRHLALAIASSGGGIGSFAFPPFIQMLNEWYVFDSLWNNSQCMCVLISTPPIGKEGQPGEKSSKIEKKIQKSENQNVE